MTHNVVRIASRRRLRCRAVFVSLCFSNSGRLPRPARTGARAQTGQRAATRRAGSAGAAQPHDTLQVLAAAGHAPAQHRHLQPEATAHARSPSTPPVLNAGPALGMPPPWPPAGAPRHAQLPYSALGSHSGSSMDEHIAPLTSLRRFLPSATGVLCDSLPNPMAGTILVSAVC